MKNLQGDIIAIADKNGKTVVTYHYDAWGKCTITKNTAPDGNLAVVNPYRYRGYYYDRETGLYYLQSRYYNPEMGRFVNGDEVEFLNIDTDILACNLFTYCENDGVDFSDYMGNLSIDKFLSKIKGAFSTFWKFIDRVVLQFIRGYQPFKVKKKRLYVNTWIISGVIDGIIKLISRVFSTGIKGFMSLLKLMLRGAKQKVVSFFKNTLIPFFRKKIGPALRTFLLSFIKVLGRLFKKNWRSVTNDFVAFNVDKIFPNTGSFANYIFNSFFSFGTLVCFFLDMSDNEFDGFYSISIA